MKSMPEWLMDPVLQAWFAAVGAAGGEARVVGGCVRDFLLGIEGADIDIASTLLPQQHIEIAAQHGWKAIPTGIDHGTVTIVLPGRVIEVTTLRRDIATDGRHAVVAYTDSWEADAARRDFTINALFMDAQGAIYDFHRGREDLQARTIRFIGDARTRIDEDALRVIRYFRFLATHGQPPADVEALAAITEKKEAIQHLSGERIANEMRKLLSAVNPSFALRLTGETGVAPFIFGHAIDASRMIRLHMLEHQSDYQTSVWARVTALLGARTMDVAWLATRWKLARHEVKQLQQLVALPSFVADGPHHHHTHILRLQGAPAYLDWVLIEATRQPGIAVAPYVALAHDFTPPLFPIAAKDLLARGMTPGKMLGETLKQLEQRWEESDYTLTKEALLGLHS